VSDRAGGPFQVRPAVRAEIRAPVAGFLRAVNCDEGERVARGAALARLEVPDLASRIAQKQAEGQETQAKLYLLEAGARQAEVAEARHKRERATHGRDRAEQDLDHAGQALRKDLERFDDLVAQQRAELNFARQAFERSQRLYERGLGPKEEFQERKKQF